MGSLPPRSLPPPKLPPAVAARARIQALEEELSACQDEVPKALLEYEIGAQFEYGLGEVESATTHYEHAYRLNPAFAPPLLALQRIHTRAGRKGELERVLEARETHATHSDRERAAALCEHAAVLLDQFAQPERAEALWEAALSADEHALDAALMLERHYLLTDRAMDAEFPLEARAEHVSDAALKASLLRELATREMARDELDAALGRLQVAAELSHGRFETCEAIELLARRLGRPQVAAESLERRGHMALRLHRDNDREVEDDNAPIGRFGSSEQARHAAASLLRDAGYLRAFACRDDEMALADYAAALSCSQDPLLLLEYMAACEQAGSMGTVAKSAAELLALGASGPDAALLHVRLSEIARQQFDLASGIESLRQAMRHGPPSPIVLDGLEAALREQDDRRALFDHLLARAQAEQADQGLLGLSALSVALWDLGDFSAAEACHELLSDLPDAAGKRVREQAFFMHYRVACLTGNSDERLRASGALCASLVDERARAFLRRDRYQQLIAMPHADDALRAELKAAVRDPACDDWAPHAARVWAARKLDYLLLAVAHRRLAEAEADGARRAAHLCAAARAHLRAGDSAEASACLQQARTADPHNGYAVALLEEVLLSEGEASEALALLRETAARTKGARGRELSLLHAGRAAELASRLDEAARSYEEASRAADDVLSPLWALQLLSERTHDSQRRLTALTGLSAREAQQGKGGVSTLELAEYHDALGHADATRAGLSRALSRPEAQTQAALRALTLEAPGPTLTSQALACLMHHCVADAESWQAESIAEQLDRGSDGEAFAKCDALDFGSEGQLAVAAWLSAPTQLDRSRAFERLSGDCIDDGAPPDLRASLALHNIRTALLTSTESTPALDLPLQMSADELRLQHPDSLWTAVALEETAGLRPAARAMALSLRRKHAPARHRYGLLLSEARARLSSDDARGALKLARELVAMPEQGPAAWEVLRAAAYGVEDYPTAVRANDRLARSAGPPLRAALLQESGRLLIEQLGDFEGAEQRLREALEVEAGHEESFGRLHDLLASRGDARGLLELLRDQLARPMPVRDRADLLYEAAGLMRALGEHTAVLDSLGELLDLVPDHVGALGLLAETHTALGQYDQAVSALRRLAAGPVPDTQRRLFRQGAADFLEQHLDDPAGAFGELMELSRRGIADAAIYRRMGELARRAGLLQEAARAYEEGAALEGGEARAELERMAAELYAGPMVAAGRARAALQRALAAAPTDLDAGEALLALSEDAGARRQILLDLTRAVQTRLGTQPASPTMLRALSRLGVLAEDAWLAYAALDALEALGLATASESERRAALCAGGAATPPLRLSQDGLRGLRPDRDGGAQAELGGWIALAVAEAFPDGPRQLGLTRRQRLDPAHPVAAELTALCHAFQVPVDGVFVGGEDPSSVHLFASPGARSGGEWLIGTAVTAPLSPAQRFLIGQQAMAQHAGVHALFQQPRRRYRDLLLACALAVDLELPAAQREPLLALARQLNRRLPRSVRRELAARRRELSELCQNPVPYLQAAHLSHLRAGLLAGGELAEGMRRLLGPSYDVAAVSHSPPALDLLRFWTSPRMATVRQASLRGDEHD